MRNVSMIINGAFGELWRVDYYTARYYTGISREGLSKPQKKPIWTAVLRLSFQCEL
jgi:hypothetical protein